MANYYYGYKSCFHSGAQPLFIIGDRSFAGAGQSSMTQNYDVNLKCNGVVMDTSGKSVIKTSKRFKELERLGRVRDYVSIDWQDMSVPAVQPEFWQKFVELLPEKCHVVVNCVGGHGRTGTALACLYLAHADCTAWEAIEFIRSDYCSYAIETDEQENYIMEVARFYGKEIGEPTKKVSKAKGKNKADSFLDGPFLQVRGLADSDAEIAFTFQYGDDDVFVERIGSTKPRTKTEIELLPEDISVLRKAISSGSHVTSFRFNDEQKYIDITAFVDDLPYIVDPLIEAYKKAEKAMQAKLRDMSNKNGSKSKSKSKKKARTN